MWRFAIIWFTKRVRVVLIIANLIPLLCFSRFLPAAWFAGHMQEPVKCRAFAWSHKQVSLPESFLRVRWITVTTLIHLPPSKAIIDFMPNDSKNFSARGRASFSFIFLRLDIPAHPRLVKIAADISLFCLVLHSLGMANFEPRSARELLMGKFSNLFYPS